MQVSIFNLELIECFIMKERDSRYNKRAVYFKNAIHLDVWEDPWILTILDLNQNLIQLYTVKQIGCLIRSIQNTRLL